MGFCHLMGLSFHRGLSLRSLYLIWFFALWGFVAYLVCRIMGFVPYLVCRIMGFVPYWVCCFMEFVSFRGLLLIEFFTLLGLSLLGLLQCPIFKLPSET